MYKFLTILLLPRQKYSITEHKVCGDIYRIIFTDSKGNYLRIFNNYK